MKIFFCDNRLGGLLGFRADVIRHLRDAGHNITLLCPEAHSDWDRVGCPIEGVRIMTIPLNPNSTNPLRDLTLVRFLVRIYRTERPDVVFNYTIKPNIYSAIAARICHIPAIDMVTGLGYMFQDNSLKRRIGRLMYKTGLRLAKRVLTLNVENQNLLLRRKFVRPEQVLLMPGGEGVNLKSYPYREKSYQSGIHFLIVSRVLYDKGYREVVEAAQLVHEHHPEIKIQWLGPVDDKSPMRVERERLDKDVAEGTIEYLGVSNHVIDYLREDGVVIVLPSYHEGMSRSLMEALATGCPIIASNISGCREMVTDGINGYRVTQRDSKGLAEAMTRMAEEKQEKLEEMSRNSYRMAQEKFDIQKVIDIYDQILTKL